MNDKCYNTIFNIIKSKLFAAHFDSQESVNWDEVALLLKNHGMILFLEDYINDIPIDAELAKDYKRIILNQKLQWDRINSITDDITGLCTESGIPCAVIKGSSAAIYYPDPHLRSAGDLDLLVRSNEIVKVHELITAYGFKGPENVADGANHIEYTKGTVELELHSKVSRLPDAEKNEYLNSIILAGMDDCMSYCLPALQNGLVLLQHIYYHLEHGLGLRQIADWMMFVHNSGLTDWEELNRITKYTGLYKLQQAVTKMCMNYLGLPDREDLIWCHEVSDELCEQLIIYILEKGNFGMNTQKDDFSSQLILAKDLKTGFRGLQFAGLRDWKAIKKYPALRPFAWAYELTLYAKGLNSNGTFLQSLTRNLTSVHSHKSLLKDLGI